MVVLSGDFSGRGNFIIQGRVAADVPLAARDVTVGRTGSVRGDIHGATICVEGEVHGNLFGEQSVVIGPSGRVRGDVTAPQVNLERGGRLRGSISTSPLAPSGSTDAPPQLAEPAAGTRRTRRP